MLIRISAPPLERAIVLKMTRDLSSAIVFRTSTTVVTYALNRQSLIEVEKVFWDHITTLLVQIRISHIFTGISMVYALESVCALWKKANTAGARLVPIATEQ